MSEAAINSPPTTSRPRPVASWLGAAALAILFVVSLIAYPPLMDARHAIETPDWVRFLGRFHVVALHLPVGVILLAAIMEFFVVIKHKSTTYLAPALNFTLMIGAWSAVISVIFGSFLARKGDFNTAEFYAHQALGIGCGAGIILTLMLRLIMETAPRFTLVYYSVFALTLAFLGIGAHFGGSLVHGSDYLTKYAPAPLAKMSSVIEGAILARFKPVKEQPGKSDPPPADPVGQHNVSVAGDTVYAALVAPILKANCCTCHNEEKSKGDLRLDSHEFILQGGHNGEVLVAGQPEKSRMITFMQLPIDDDDHMPPPKKPQPSDDEIALLSWWIKEGASKDLKVTDAKLPEKLKRPVAKPVADAKGEPPDSTPPASPDIQQAVADEPVDSDQGTVAPLALVIQQGAAKPPEPAPTVATKPQDPNANVFKSIIAPILADKCTSCHSKEKTKGKLRMDTFADLVKGGSDGATTVVPLKPDDSLMLKRVNLPLDDDDHMPPQKEKQPGKEEIAILKWWIENGASETQTLGASTKTPEIEGFIKKVALAQSNVAPASARKAETPNLKPLTPAAKKIVEEVTARVSALNASLLPLAQDSPQLRFNCINAADKFGDKELAELTPAAEHIAWLDVARSKVTDAGLAVIASMTNLERLHLENTAVTDAGLVKIAALPQLQYLNLYGTKVTDAGIAKLAANKQLKKLFVWQTAVTPAAARRLEEAVPGLVVDTGL